MYIYLAGFFAETCASIRYTITYSQSTDASERKYLRARFRRHVKAIFSVNRYHLLLLVAVPLYCCAPFPPPPHPWRGLVHFKSPGLYLFRAPPSART